MRIKKSILIVCIAVCLFAMAGVCAEDVNDTAIGPVDEKLEANAEDIQVIEEADDGESIGETDNGTFQALNIKIQNAPENTTVNLTNDYKNTDGFSAEGIYIDKNLTIDGMGHKIDADKKSRIFNIKYGIPVIFKNITFINGERLDGDGGAIHGLVNAYYAINCTFENNTANGGGGAICAGYAIGCVFNGNRASVGGGAICAGYAIGCVFNGNSANKGGAMIGGSAVDCVFNGNTANEGGAMRGVSAVDCVFNGNTAYEGGAMHGGSATGCIFNENVVQFADGGAMYEGSAINCIFNGNSAGRRGGAMYDGSADSCIFETPSDTTTDNTIILQPTFAAINFTSFYGSGEKLLFALKTNSTGEVILNRSINVAIYDAGGVRLFSFNCTSDGWTVNLTAGSYVAQCNATDHDVALSNATLTVIPASTLWALNRTVNANSDSQINLANDYSFDPDYDADFADGIVINRTVTINGNGFTIDAKNQARIFNIQADGVTVRNLTFKNANTSGSGGAIYWGGDYGIVSSCSFVNNSAVFFGGAINWGGINGVVSACSFVNNSANYSGGAINWGSRNGAVSGCSFENNSASNGGGAVRWSSSKGILCNSSFVNNSSPNGGAVFWSIGPGSVCNCSFLNNSAGEGIVYFEKDVGSGLNVNGNIFSANNCSAIAFLKIDPTSNIDSNWYDNDADYAGGPNLPQQNSWLVLNATADPATISYSDTAEVMFALYLYDPVSGNSSLYDRAQFEKIRLSITAIKGNAPSLAKFGEKITFTSTEAGNGGVTATLGHKSLTVNLTINKAQTAIEASPVTAKYGEDKYLTVTLRDDKGNPIAGANITVNMNGIKTYTTDKNGQIKVKTQGIVPKTYTAKIAFGGNANYVQSAKDVKITIKKAKPKLAAKNKKFKKSKKVKKYAVTLKDANKKPIKKAKLTLKIKGKKAITVKTNKKGKATFKIKKLTKKGRYSAKVTFKGDKCYTKLAKKVKITVK